MKFTMRKKQKKNKDLNINQEYEVLTMCGIGIRSQRAAELLNEKGYLDQILVEGAQKANDIASKKIKEIHKIMGF